MAPHTEQHFLRGAVESSGAFSASGSAEYVPPGAHTHLAERDLASIFANFCPRVFPRVRCPIAIRDFQKK